LTICRGA